MYVILTKSCGYNIITDEDSVTQVSLKPEAEPEAKHFSKSNQLIIDYTN